jgi:hypothetical protein
MLFLLLRWVGSREAHIERGEVGAPGEELDKDESAYLAESDAKKKRLAMGCLITVAVLFLLAVLVELIR